MSLATYAVLNDIHFVYESPAYYAALAQMKNWPNLKHIYLNGDIAEIESVSTHPKGPTAQKSLLVELDYLRERLDEIEKMFPGVPVTYLSGNHEYRMYRFIRDVAPEMWGMLHAPTLLNFDRRPSWRYVDYGPSQLVKIGATTDLYCRHEPLAGGQVHAKGTAEKSIVSIIYGHTHVIQSYTAKKFGPKPYWVHAFSNGWLGNLQNPCFDYRGSKDNWQLGFGRVDCDEASGVWEYKFIRLE